MISQGLTPEVDHLRGARRGLFDYRRSGRSSGWLVICTSDSAGFPVCEQPAKRKAEPVQDTFQPWQFSDVVLSVLNVGVKQRGNQVGTLVAGKLESVYEARYFNCGSLKFRNSRLGGSKVFHTKGQRIFSHGAAGAGDAGSILSATQ